MTFTEQTRAAALAWGLPAVTFLTMIAYLPGIPSATTAGRWAVMAAGTSLLLLVPLRPSSSFVGGQWTGAALLTWAALSVVWSVSPFDSIGAVIQLFALGAMFALGAVTVDLTRVWGALVIGAAVSLPFTALQYVGLQPVQDALRAGFHDNDGRLLSGLFLARDPFTQIAVIAAVAAAGLRRYFVAAAFLAAVYLAGGRTPALMLAAAALVWAWHRAPIRQSFVVVLALIMAVAFFVAFTGGGSGLNRAEIWTTTIENFSILGAGAGTFKVAWPGYGFAHNEFLQLGFELGVGSIFLIGTIAHAFRCPGHVLDKAILAALMGSALVWQPFQLPATALVAAFVLGHLCAGAARVRRAELEGGVAGLSGVQHTKPDGRGEVCPPRGSWPYLSV